MKFIHRLILRFRLWLLYRRLHDAYKVSHKNFSLPYPFEYHVREVNRVWYLIKQTEDKLRRL